MSLLDNGTRGVGRCLGCDKFRHGDCLSRFPVEDTAPARSAKLNLTGVDVVAAPGKAIDAVAMRFSSEHMAAELRKDPWINEVRNKR